MPKNILQDIVPPEKRSIRNIPVPNRSHKSGQNFSDVRVKKSKGKISQTTDPTNGPTSEMKANKFEGDDVQIYQYKNEDSESKFSFFSFGSKKGILVSFFVAIFIIAIAISSLFSGATVTVFPKMATASVIPEKTFVAKRDPTSGELGFEVMKITKSAGKLVAANGEEEVERKASGTIVIYNNFDSNNQRLIKNTRFESPDGLIYRVNESVVVPGKKTVNGEVVPGSIEVVVYADEPGEKYNIEKVDFTIPGFKGDPRFNQIYARSKSDMTGGFVGVVKKVAEADASKARDELHMELEADLRKDAESQLPEDFIFFDDGIFFEFSSLPQSDESGSTVTLNEEGTLYGIMFNKNDFAKLISVEIAPDIAKNETFINDQSTFTFAIKDKKTINPVDPDSISFNLSGTITFVSEFNEDLFKSDLVNQPKKNLNYIVGVHPGIEEAKVKIRPFWKRTLPSKAEDITIKIGAK